MARNTVKLEKREIHTVRSGLWQENWKTCKMIHKHLWPGICVETLKTVENENFTLWDLEYGEETENHGKWETHTVEPGIWRETLKNVKNKKYTG